MVWVEIVKWYNLFIICIVVPNVFLFCGTQQAVCLLLCFGSYTSANYVGIVCNQVFRSSKIKTLTRLLLLIWVLVVDLTAHSSSFMQTSATWLRICHHLCVPACLHVACLMNAPSTMMSGFRLSRCVHTKWVVCRVLWLLILFVINLFGPTQNSKVNW